MSEQKDVRELIIRADSLLSLLWHRHVPADRKDAQLAIDVNQTIGDLRSFYERKPGSRDE